MKPRELAGETAEQAHERGYIEGRRFSDLARLREILRSIAGLGADENLAVKFGQLQVERLETIARLRDICRDHGDNDWPDDLHLADIVEKHLHRHLGAK
jgi:hypothetical protein